MRYRGRVTKFQSRKSGSNYRSDCDYDEKGRLKRLSWSEGLGIEQFATYEYRDDSDIILFKLLMAGNNKVIVVDVISGEICSQEDLKQTLHLTFSIFM